MTVEWDLSGALDVDGDAVRYGVFGDGPPVVLVHGTPFSSHEWHWIAPQLAVTHRVHLFDLLGYGRSAMRAGQDVSLGVQNGILAALLDRWGLDRPLVVAHDFGGATALRAHLLSGCDYERLLLIDPVAIAPWGSPFVRHVRDHEAAFAGIPGYIHEAIVRAYLRDAIHQPVSDDALGPYVAPWRGETGRAAFYRQIAQMDMRYTDEIEALIPDVRCPVSILWGAEDKWIPAAQGRRLHGMIPGSAYREVAGAGHLMQEDAPAAIVAEFYRFMA